jgi:polyphosphate kinase
MSKIELTAEDIEVLNSKIGLKNLLANKKIKLDKVLKNARHELKFRAIQEELVKLQLWVIANNKRVLVLFHGGDSSEKSTIIRKILSHNNPRHFRIEVNLPKKEGEEKDDYYFKKFIEKLPKAGEMVFWDRSWYNRALFETIGGICTKEEYDGIGAGIIAPCLRLSAAFVPKRSMSSLWSRSIILTKPWSTPGSFC